MTRMTKTVVEQLMGFHSPEYTKAIFEMALLESVKSLEAADEGDLASCFYYQLRAMTLGSDLYRELAVPTSKIAAGYYYLSGGPIMRRAFRLASRTFNHLDRHSVGPLNKEAARSIRERFERMFRVKIEEAA